MKIELFYTLACPACKVFKKMLDEVLTEFEDKFELKKSMANSPVGMIRTMKLNIHSVPALLINGELVFRAVPTKEELISKLKNY